LGWLRPDDPRSELTLALIQERNGVSLLLDGLPTEGDTLSSPDPQMIKAISPLSQVQAGRFNTPTFIIIGTEDEVVPFHTSVDFAQALREHGISSGILPVTGAKHIFDLQLTPGTSEWDKQIAPGYYFLFDALGLNYNA
jgi:acetyl esterase/lipase